MPRCKHCRERFEAKYFLQKYCLKDDECIETELKERAEKLASKEQKPKAKIPRRSEQRIKEDPIYTKDRLQFLSLPENHRCFIEGCGARATTIEHTRGRRGYADEWARDNKISLYIDVRFWKPCCWTHNGEIEGNTELSLKYQLSKISGKEKLQKQPL